MSRKPRKPIYLSDEELKTIFDGLIFVDVDVKKKMARWKNPSDVSSSVAMKNHLVETSMIKVMNEMKQRGIDDQSES